MIDPMLTEKEREWLKELKSVFRRMPKRIEVIVVDINSIEVWKRGSFRKHMGSEYDGAGMDERNIGFEGRFFADFKVSGSGSVIAYPEGK